MVLFVAEKPNPRNSSVPKISQVCEILRFQTAYSMKVIVFEFSKVLNEIVELVVIWFVLAF